jgi:Tol biopolymer transport system component
VIKNFPNTITGVWAGQDKVYHLVRPLMIDPQTGKEIMEYAISHYKTKEIFERIRFGLDSEFSPRHFFRDDERILGKIYERVGDATVTNIAVYNKKTKELTKLTHFTDIGYLMGPVSTSPNEDKIAYSFSKDIGSKIQIIDLNGNLIEEIAGGGSEPAWSPDGATIAYTTGSTRLRLYDFNSKESKEITRFEEIIGNPDFSPDGKQIVFVIWGGQGTKKNLAVINTDGTGFRRLLSDKDAGGGISEPYWQA